ncbi:hypothetical protein C1645_808873 [Glomus cerebriforme]|uniref:BTB/POZ domain-containing protein n=1 Tax=Glomus cerebriforme TaxID=658196 RepID=A0A397SD79_9GLOM|nr:hypothetical protein C1645_808873 [Glomus cerebriforme]
MPFECPQEVVNDYEKLLEFDEGYDVIIYAGENENVKEIHAHSNILRIRSQYFRTALSKEWSEKKDGKFIFKKTNISPQFFKMILRFIYCGKIDLEKLQGPDVLKLLIAVDEINIQTLTNYIQEYLIKHQDKFLQQNPIGILEAIYQHEAFTNLWNSCLEKICEEPEPFFNSGKFITLKAPLLELLLKRDDLSLDEIILWDSLIKWCLAQHSNVSRDPAQWNKDEIAIMERTIHSFVPLIRFCHISSEDFIIKVHPFREILPMDLVINMLKFHMAPNKQLNMDIQPPRQPKCIYDSTLIKAEHFAIFSGWIDKKNVTRYNLRNIPFNFNLLYRASRDGNTPAAFHAKCNNKGATIVVVKLANSEQIVGGYNPLVWDSTQNYKSTRDSFIFSFTNKNNLQTAKVGYILDARIQYAIYSQQGYGPTFGGGHDLFQNSNSNWQSFNPHSYPKIDMPENFTMNANYKVFNVDDYEVFQVIKNNLYFILTIQIRSYCLVLNFFFNNKLNKISKDIL